MKPERRPKQPTIRQLQGEQFLRGIHGKAIDQRLTEALYDSPFALDQLGKGLLTIRPVIRDGQVKDLIEYAGCDLT